MDGGDGAGDEKKNYTQEKIVEEIKGMLKKERKKEKKHAGWKFPSPP